MCAVCGCGGSEAKLETGHAHEHEHEHVAPDGTVYRHSHAHAHGHGAHAHDHGAHEHEHVGPDGTVTRHSHAHAPQDHDHGAHPHDHHHPAAEGTRLLQVEQDILAKNNRFAAVNRRLFEASGVFCVNLMSSPGSGKTTLLERTLADLKGRFPAAVIEGDQQTSADAERIRATGTPAVQVNTGKGCHLDAQMVTQAVGELPLPKGAVLFVENVGNLVCPAGFDLGEAARAVVVSVTEGEDKPLKYPNMFATADVVLVNKVDLLPHLRFDLARLIANARKIKPGVAVLEVSATAGDGLDAWYGWIEAGRARLAAAG